MTGLLPKGSSRQDFVRAVNDLRQRLGSGALGEEAGALISKKLDRLFGDKDKQGKKSLETPVKKAAERGKPAAKTIDQRVCRAGNVIFQEGDPGDEAFFITSGEVEISLKSGDRDIIIATVGRGDIIGEMALIDDQPRMATAKALTDTTLSIIPQEAFKKRLGRLAEEDRIIHRLLEIFVDRLRNQARNL
ncbi:MAG TPA: cyclic nucleotide-binding domain-containing protein [Rhodospirillaceae bacterium]|nr:cyclic nucleotide-binding domain-containing protein [Rhodospirillaceae bacterium]HIJ44833.1 cyclic nucleotide-binding domain-containing protein [Rhodospirillaceae bacterium]HIJ92978.1 cyclic nucleotide-binding domain-containing protein [Rhodospirillaceae bacterium]